MMSFIERNVPALVLAPMDGVTDFLMRELLTELLPLSYCVTEFVRVAGAVPPEWILRREMPELESGCKTASGAPVQLQLLGGDPDLMAKSAERAVSLGATAIDINFGCPAPTVNRHDGGATLLKFPERIEKIVSSVRAAVPAHLPVSAKLRLGWDDMGAIHENAERAERGGASWITIHGRTKFQGYTPPAYWEPIGVVRRNRSIPVVANGEIWSADDLARCIDATGCVHFMLGRGVLAEPGCVFECAKVVGVPLGERRVFQCGDDRETWGLLLRDLIRRSRSLKEPEKRSVARLKQWLNYGRHKGQVSWFDHVKRLLIADEILEFMQQGAPNVASGARTALREAVGE